MRPFLILLHPLASGPAGAPPTPPAWSGFGGVGQITIISAPVIAAPVGTGGVGQIIITG